MKLREKPLLFVCAVSLFTHIFCYLVPASALILCTAASSAAVLLFALFFLMGKRRLLLPGALLLAAALAALVSHSYFGVALHRADKWCDGQVHTLEGTVKKTEYTASYGAEYLVSVRSIDGEECRVTVRLQTDAPALDPSDRFSAPVTLSQFRDNVNGYAEKASSWSDGISVFAEQADGEIHCTGKEPLSLSDRILIFRQSLSDRYCDLLGERGGSLYCALFVGDRSHLRSEDTLAVRRSGVSHLLAVSGMHFSLMMGLAARLLSRFPIGGNTKKIILLLLTFCYAVLTGFSPSVIRAAIMLAVAYAGYLLRMEKDAMTSLFFAAALLLLFAPRLVLDPGYWLTFAATYGILLFSPALRRLYLTQARIRREARMKRERGTLSHALRLRAALASGALALLAAVCVSAAAVTAALPVLCLFFGSVSLISLPCGLVLTPLITLCLILSPFLLLFGWIPPVAWAANALASLFFSAVKVFSSLPGIMLGLDSRTVGVCFLFGAVLCLLTISCLKDRRFLMIPAALTVLSVLLCSCCALFAARSRSDGIFTSFGSGDHITLCGESGTLMLNMGSGSKSSLRAALGDAAALPEKEIGAYIVTSIRKDHRASVAYLCRTAYVRTVYLPTYVSPDAAICRHTAEEAALAGVEVRYFRFGEPFDVNGYTVLVDGMTYLSRSVLPVYRVTVTKGDSSLCWLGSSYREAGLTSDAGLCFKGGYGPRDLLGGSDTAVPSPVRFSLSDRAKKESVPPQSGSEKSKIPALTE